MARIIVKIKDKYLEWSTCCDAPATYGMTLEEFKQYYIAENGTRNADDLCERLKRVDKKGTSSFIDSSLESTISGNRAGENETELTLDEIYEKYCK